jgi:uncharacterized membrane protein
MIAQLFGSELDKEVWLSVQTLFFVFEKQNQFVKFKVHEAVFLDVTMRR